MLQTNEQKNNYFKNIYNYKIYMDIMYTYVKRIKLYYINQDMIQ